MVCQLFAVWLSRQLPLMFMVLVMVWVTVRVMASHLRLGLGLPVRRSQRFADRLVGRRSLHYAR